MTQPVFKLLRYRVFQVFPDKAEEQLYESMEIPDQKEVDLKEGATYEEGIQSYLRILFYVKEQGIKGLTCKRKVFKGPICVNTQNTLMGDFEPSEEVQEYNFEVLDTPSGFFVRGGFSLELQFFDQEDQLLMKIKYPFQIIKAKPK